MAVNLKVGDLVEIRPSGLQGVVKFKGPTKFATGQWIGVLLDEPEGKNDGTVQGVKYFTAEPNYGLFVKPDSVVRINQGMSAKAVPNGARVKRVNSVDFDPKVLVLNTVHVDLIPASLDYENAAFLRILVEEDGVSVMGCDEFGNTALHAVCKKGGGEKAVNVLQYLLGHGLEESIHNRNIFGETAVMLAAKEHNWKEMQYLISIGADVISKGSGDSLASVWDHCRNIEAGTKALHEGMKKQRESRANGEIRVPKMAHKRSTLAEALFKTARAGDRVYVRMLLEERDMNVNCCDRDGNNVLHHIANDSKRLPLIKYIVAMGGRIHAKNKVGDTPCLVAARTRSWENMQYLVSIGSSISIKDASGCTVFKYAQANLQSRKAMADALAEKKELGLTEIGDSHEDGTNPEDQYDEKNQYDDNFEDDVAPGPPQ